MGGRASATETALLCRGPRETAGQGRGHPDPIITPQTVSEDPLWPGPVLGPWGDTNWLNLKRQTLSSRSCRPSEEVRHRHKHANDNSIHLEDFLDSTRSLPKHFTCRNSCKALSTL